MSGQGVNRRTARGLVDNTLFVSYLILVAIYPIVNGAKTLVVMVFFSLVASLLLLIWGTVHLRNSQRVCFRLQEFRYIVILLLLWVGYTFLQAIPFLGVSSAVDFNLDGSLPSFMMEARYPISRDGLETWRCGLLYSSCLSIFLLTLLLLNSWVRLWSVVGIFVIVGVFETTFGLANYISEEALFGWAPSHWSYHKVTGTYKNKNHFANIMLLVSAIPLGMHLSFLSKDRYGFGLGAKLVLLFNDFFRLKGLMMVVLILFGIAILLSQSRGAIVAGGVALIAVLLLRWFRFRSRFGFIGVIGVPIVIIGLLGATGLSDRFTTLAVEPGGRIDQWRLSLPMTEISPLLGIGAGSYRSVFSGFKSPSLPPLRYDHVHNDYLELVIEQGILGFLVLGFSVLSIVVILVKRYFSTNSRRKQGVLLGSIFGMIAMLTHAIVDFPFQIPANAVYFFVLCAIGLVSGSIRPLQKLAPRVKYPQNLI